eukprot:s2434_g2.t1
MRTISICSTRGLARALAELTPDGTALSKEALEERVQVVKAAGKCWSLKDMKIEKDYEKNLRSALIKKFERPDRYEKVDVLELALQSSEQAARYEGFVDRGYRWKAKDPASAIQDMKEERRIEERLTLCRREVDGRDSCCLAVIGGIRRHQAYWHIEFRCPGPCNLQVLTAVSIDLVRGLRLGNEAGVTIRRTDGNDGEPDLTKALPIEVQKTVLERLAAQRLRKAPTRQAQQAARQLRRRGSIRLRAGV